MSSISESLHQAIERWLGKSKNNNLHMLANKLDIPYTTLHRTATGQVDEPQFKTVIAIINLILSKEERREFFSEHYPLINNTFDDGYDGKKARDRHDQYERPDIEQLLSHRDGFLLAQHLISRCGITEEKIKDLYGYHGLNIVHALADTGSAEYSDGVWRIRTEDTYIGDNLDSCLRQIGFAASTFKDESGQVRAGYVRILSESVTLEAAQRIREELDAVAARIDQIICENPGKHVFVATLSTQLLDPKAAVKEYNATKKGESK